MAFASLKKKIAVNNRFLSEKFSKTKETCLGADYVEISKIIDTYKSYLEDARKRSMECFEPGMNIRIRPTANVSGSHNQPARDVYPHAEYLLAECFAKHSAAFGQDTSIGSALDTASDGYRQLSEAKARAVEEVQSRFTDPITETLNQELKEIIKLRKKSENRRLAFEVQRTKVKKGKTTLQDPEYMESESKFKESYEISRSAMSNFLESEAEHVELLCNLVTAHLSFFQDAQAVLTDLQTRMKVKLEESRSVDKVKVGESSSRAHALSSGPSYTSQGEPVCRALFNFDAENPFELSFKEGEEIKLLKKVDDNWYLGELNGEEGHFPTTYVEVLVPLPPSADQAPKDGNPF